jgi:hypothetical protein
VFPAALTLAFLTTAPADTPRALNLDFARGSLDGWKGSGFALVAAGLKGTPSPLAVSSADAGKPGRRAVLRYVFVVPPGAHFIRFHAHASVPPGSEPDARLNVLLLGAKNRVLPKQVRSGTGWSPAKGLLSPLNGQPREYSWDVSAHVGKTLQIALIDQDDRPGCHVVSTGFRLEGAGGREVEEFARHMATLVRNHKLAPVTRFDSKHFTAWSNAGAEFTTARLQNCETLYKDFLAHFRAKGFAVQAPTGRLMVAVFESQSGFDAYLGGKMPGSLVGIYHPPSNRLVIYDIHHNRGVVDGKQRAAKISTQIPFDIDRVQFIGGAERHFRAFAEDANVSTTIHEAAHQISFNCGLLNRKSDVAPWLAEGLATYCEPSVNGSWQGPGAPNYARVKALAAGLRGKGQLVPLTTLVGSGDWRKDSATLLTGYAQSWALFRMLMEERPRELRAYLTLIRDRRTPDHRLTDFRQVFGPDLSALDRRYQEYLREMVLRFGPSESR